MIDVYFKVVQNLCTNMFYCYIIKTVCCDIYFNA